jgi:phage-related minor tail protein
MGAEDAKKLADGLALIAQRYQAIANVQSANLSQSRTWEEGWKSAFDSYMENSTNAAKVAGDAFSSFTSNMNSAIDNFVATGKFSFGDFARSVIQDLIKIELKAQASKILSGVLSGAGSFFSSLLGFAEGGQPPINKPSIVGEKGPELFVPKTAGTIVPNGGSAGGAGQAGAGGNTYITNNISAVDAKSVAQLFAENRKTLFGTVEMARKEMSYGR